MDLISKLLTVDASKRLTVDDALKHPWINTVSSELESRNLENSKVQLRKYLARRKFRKAVLAHVAVGRFKRALFNRSSYTDHPEEEGEEVVADA